MNKHNNSNAPKIQPNKRSITASLHLNHFLPPFRQSKILSQQQTNVVQPKKRIQTYPSTQKAHRRHGSSLHFSKNLFKDAKKVDKKNPKQSFLPVQSQLTDNKTKVKILLSAYSKLNKRQSLSPKSSDVHRMHKNDQISAEAKRQQYFKQPALSSLTRLILNECKVVYGQNSNRSNEQLDSSLHQLINQRRYSELINVLSEFSVIPHKKDHPSIDLQENPYQLFIPKVSRAKQRSKLGGYYLNT